MAEKPQKKKTIIQRVCKVSGDKTPKDKKGVLLFISFVVASILLLVLPSVYLSNTFKESLVASIIGAFLTLGIAYFFVDRYRRERDRKERERRRDIQKEILDEMSFQLTFLIQAIALDFANYFKQPNPTREALFFRICKTHDNFDEFLNILKNEALRLDLIDIDKFDVFSFYPSIFGIDQFTQNMSREMLYHQGTLDDLRPVIRIFNHFQHALGRCMAKMEMYRHGYKPKDESSKKADVSELTYLCNTIIKILRAIDDAVAELSLGERKTGISKRYFS
ncbi:MAG: hypothetical protein U9N44_07340 [Chloroflexota bacterium]|nr:hypothetical protein [Chloroflexota bacterium]